MARVSLRKALALTVAAAAILVACGGDSPTPTATPNAVATTPVPTATATPAPEASPTATATPTTAPTTPSPTPQPTPTATPTPTPAPTVTPSPTPTPVPSPEASPTPSPTQPISTLVPRPALPQSPTFDTPPGAYTAITVGGYYACALTEDGEAVCWNITSGDTWDTPPGTYTFITAADGDTCAITDEGEIVCWGWRGEPIGETWPDPSRDAPPGRYAAISVMGSYACALTEADEAVCWGPEDGWVPPPELPSGTYRTLSLGGSFITEDTISYFEAFLTACATTDDGDLVCWRGVNTGFSVEQTVERTPGNHVDVHVLKDSVCTLTLGGAVNCWGRVDDGSTRHIALAVGGSFACGITGAGPIQCHRHGILDGFFGLSGTRWLMNAPDPDPGRGYAAVSVGDAYACALTDAGEAICWGNVDNTVAPPDPAPGRYVAVSDGYGHTCALTEDGEAVCWGWNNFRQANVPEGRYTAISAGFASTCALTEAGGVLCWGAARSGGGGGASVLTAPVQHRYRAISTGYDVACALTEGGEPVCFGDWSLEEAPSGPFVAITLSWTGHACALGEDGAIACWADWAQHGELDAPPGSWKAIDAGDFHTCAIDDAGNAVCWGDPAGQLPDAPTGRYVAVGTSGYDTCLLTDAGQVLCRDMDGWEEEADLRLVNEGFQAMEMSVGRHRTCALTEAGAVACWGDTDYLNWPFLNRHGYQPGR